jgi:hypothetical protein
MTKEFWQYPSEKNLCLGYSAFIFSETELRKYCLTHGSSDTRMQAAWTSNNLSISNESTSSSSVTTEIENVICAISGLIRIPQPAEIREYLLRFPDMISILPCICFHSSLEFTSIDQLSLELYKDYETDDRYLSLYIRQTHYDSDIMDKIEKLWLNFESLISGSKGWINITTDFRSPI